MIHTQNQLTWKKVITACCVIVAIPLLTSCFFKVANRSATQLLSLAVIESNSMPFDEFNQRIVNTPLESIPWASDPLEVAMKFVSISGGKQRVITLDDSSSASHVVLIIDKITDDSVRGYRYDIKLESESNRYLIIDAQESWNCWEDRGHQEYSNDPCT